MAGNQNIHNVFTWQHQIAKPDESKTLKFMKKKGGTMLAPVLKELKKQDHHIVINALGRHDQENETYTEWFNSAFAHGFNANAQAHFLCDGLRYFGIFQSLVYDKWGSTCNYCLPTDNTSLLSKIGTADYPILQELASKPEPAITLFGQKWNKGTEFKSETVAAVVYQQTEDPKLMLGVLQTHINKFDEWKEDPQTAAAITQGYVLRAPTMLCITYPGGTKIKDVTNKQVKEQMLNFGVGWTEDTDFRLSPANFVNFLSNLGDKYASED